jgi:cation-transporting ATPase 13A3/4/5
MKDVSYAACQRLAREDVEKDLIFGGLIVLENRLKPQTAGIIAMLRQAKMKMIMVTGN